MSHTGMAEPRRESGNRLFRAVAMDGRGSPDPDDEIAIGDGRALLRLRTQYRDRYLGAFCYRFNRRFDLADLVVRLVVELCRCAATPERVVRQA